jgi:DNA-binding transcriptional MocR family regulator
VVRSVSKSLGPDLRLAAFTGDDVTVDRVAGRLRAGPGWVSHLLQGLAADLGRDAAAQARVAKAAETYAERRAALIDALAGHGIAAHGRSGVNVWVPVPAEAPVVAGLASRGWAVAPGERYRLRTGPGVRVTVASLSPADARRLAIDLAALLHPTGVAAV